MSEREIFFKAEPKLSKGTRKYIRKLKAAGDEAASEAIVRAGIEKSRLEQSVKVKESARKAAEEKKLLKELEQKSKGKDPIAKVEAQFQLRVLDLKRGEINWPEYEQGIGYMLDNLEATDRSLSTHLLGTVEGPQGTEIPRMLHLRRQIIPDSELSQYRKRS
jgi:hypothetical protein